MKSNAIRAIIGIVSVAIAVALFIALQDDGDNASEQQDPQPTQSDAPARTAEKQEAEPTIPRIVVRNGKPVGGVKELTSSRGDRVRFKVSSDVGDEVHLHGYDISKDVRAGGSINFDFRADLEGIFEVELEHRAEPIAELQVNP